jgi:acyl-CoA thioesterase-1
VKSESFFTSLLFSSSGLIALAGCMGVASDPWALSDAAVGSDSGLLVPADAGGRPDGGVAPDAGPGKDSGAAPTDGGPSGIVTCPAELGTAIAVSPGTASSRVLTANPIVSRTAAAEASVQSSQCSGACASDDPVVQLFQGAGSNGNWQGVAGDYVMINVGSGPTKLLLTWLNAGYPEYSAAGSFNIATQYTIDVSSDGAHWQQPVVYTNNQSGTAYRTREHVFAFAGMSWVRFTINAFQGGGYAQFTSMDIYDASNGTDDTWAFLGSGPSRGTYSNASAPSFQDVIHTCHPGYMPATINLADLGGGVSYLAQNIDAWLALNPDMHFWVLAYGLDDANYCGTPGAPTDPMGFSTTLQSAITKIVSAGHVPVLPHVQAVGPDSSLPCPSPMPATCDFGTQGSCPGVEYLFVDQFNAQIDQLVQANHLLPTPDLFAWFQQSPAQLCQSTNDCEVGWVGVEPLDVGVVAINRLWAAAADTARLYAP